MPTQIGSAQKSVCPLRCGDTTAAYDIFKYPFFQRKIHNDISCETSVLADYSHKMISLIFMSYVSTCCLL